MNTPQKYNAFISYSRKDEIVAKSLEKYLEQYKIPKPFQVLNQKKFSIFRDIQDIELGELSEKLREGLDQSDFLILLCSPNSYKSIYVGEEIKYFGEKKGKEKILPVLIGGRPNQEVKKDDAIQDHAFNEELFHFFKEPLSADLRKTKELNYFKRRARDREARFQIISRLLYTTKSNELVGRYLLSIRIRLGLLGLFALLVFAFLGWRYYDNIPKDGITYKANSTLEEKNRTIKNLKVLNQEIKNQLPQKSNKNNLLIATWNIRDFDEGIIKSTSGKRSEESLSYIAEVISHYDIVAIQEVKEDLRPLEQVMSYLGKHWDKKFTGVSSGSSGNNERLGFIFDKRKIQLGDMTDEIVLDDGIKINDTKTVQISRTPYFVEFLVNGSKIHFCNVHIYYGNSTGSKLERRLNEIRKTTKFLKKRIEKNTSVSRLVLLGDMNVDNPDHQSMKIIKENGFVIPDSSVNKTTNLNRNKYYDQIAFATSNDSIKINILSGGSLDFYKYVYREEDQSIYEPIFIEHYREGRVPKTDKEKSIFYARWKSGQMSDHLIKWVELEL